MDTCINLLEVEALFKGVFSTKVENALIDQFNSNEYDLPHSSLSAGAVVIKHPSLLATYKQSIDGTFPNNENYYIDYELGRVHSNPLYPLPNKVAVSYSYDPYQAVTMLSIMDISQRLSIPKSVTINFEYGVLEYDLPHDFMFEIAIDCGNCSRNNLGGIAVCHASCNSHEYNCGKLILSEPVSGNCCLSYGAGFFPNEDGTIDLPTGYLNLILLKGMAIGLSNPTYSTLGSNNPQGSLIERTYKIGDETVTRKWDSGSSALKMADWYCKKFELHLSAFLPKIGLSKNTDPCNHTYHGIHC